MLDDVEKMEAILSEQPEMHEESQMGAETQAQSAGQASSSSLPPQASNNRILWLALAFVAVVAAVAIGFIVGTTIEGDRAEEAYNDDRATLWQQATQAIAQVEADAERNQGEAAGTLIAAQAEATEAVRGLSTDAARSDGDGRATLDAFSTNAIGDMQTLEAEATQAIEDSQAQATSAVATINANATQRIIQGTQTLAVNQTATALRNRIETRSAIAFTPTASNTPTPSQTYTPEIPEGVVNVVAVPVYLGPGLDYPIVDTLTQDISLSIIAVSPNGAWLEIAYERDNTEMGGFVQSTAVRRTGGSLEGLPIAQDYPPLTPTAEATSTPDVPAGRVDVVLATVYDAPSTEAAILGVLPLDTMVSIEGITDDGRWLQVATAELEGFVQADALRFSGGNAEDVDLIIRPTQTATTPPPTPSLTAPPATPEQPEAVAAGQFIVVRAGPAETFPTLGLVGTGVPLTIVGVSVDGAWFQVEYAEAPDGFGWVSGQVVNAAGDLSKLPVVEAPTMPDNNTDIGPDSQTTDTEDGVPVSRSQLPEVGSSDYDLLPGINAYSYAVAVSIEGLRDGNPYFTYLRFEYAQDDAGNLRITVDSAGDLQKRLMSEELNPLLDFMPFVIGVQDGVQFFYSPSDDTCFDLGDGANVGDIRALLEGIVTQDGLFAFDELPDAAVFEQSAANLLGIEGTQYQLTGVESESGVQGIDDIKADLWWSADNQVLYGYRIRLDVSTDTLFLYQDVLASLEPTLRQASTFEGTAIVELQPQAINENAEAGITIPASCAYLFE